MRKLKRIGVALGIAIGFLVLLPFITKNKSFLVNASEEQCVTQGKEGISTSLGCLPVEDVASLSTRLLQWGMGIGGGVAFVLIIYAGYIIMTGAGNPQKVQAAKELMTSAVTGLLLMIFAVFLLNLIGIDILGIPDL